MNRIQYYLIFMMSGSCLIITMCSRREKFNKSVRKPSCVVSTWRINAPTIPPNLTRINLAMLNLNLSRRLI